jgi:hypothetical protein
LIQILQFFLFLLSFFWFIHKGHTQTLNFFKLGPPAGLCVFVCLFVSSLLLLVPAPQLSLPGSVPDTCCCAEQDLICAHPSIPIRNRRFLLSLVDMPGYGFAFARPDVVQAWAGAMKVYLTERTTLKRVLLDARHGLKQIDRDYLAFLEASLPGKARFCLVLTKCDLVSPIDLGRRLTLLNAEIEVLRKCLPCVMLVSSKSPKSIKVLQKDLLSLASPA